MPDGLNNPLFKAFAAVTVLFLRVQLERNIDELAHREETFRADIAREQAPFLKTAHSTYRVFSAGIDHLLTFTCRSDYLRRIHIPIPAILCRPVNNHDNTPPRWNAGLRLCLVRLLPLIRSHELTVTHQSEPPAYANPPFRPVEPEELRAVLRNNWRQETALGIPLLLFLYYYNYLLARPADPLGTSCANCSWCRAHDRHSRSFLRNQRRVTHEVMLETLGRPHSTPLRCHHASARAPLELSSIYTDGFISTCAITLRPQRPGGRFFDPSCVLC